MASPAPQPAVTLHRPVNPQIGLNFIRFYCAEGRNNSINASTPYYQPEWIFNDFRALGIQTYRQFVKADLLWNVVEPQDDQWNFTAADAVIPNADFEPIVTLFAMQYSSGTPPWVTDPALFQKEVGPEAQNYLETVVRRYAPYVKYWELGNEMDHWRAADPGSERGRDQLPAAFPREGFSPQEQGRFLAQAAAVIRANDPDAVIVMPAMGGLDANTVATWMGGVIEGGGPDWFDVVNYHFYSSWEAYGKQRANFQQFLADHQQDGKPVWLTETGATASESLTLRTHYPNSPESQAADIFRRTVSAYAHGDAMVIWHTYLDSPDVPMNDWRGYGIRQEKSEPRISYYALRLLIQELIPFRRAELLAEDPRAVNSYRFETESGAVKYIVWGKGSWTVPAEVTQRVSVVPAADGSYAWQPVKAGETLSLSPIPVLLK
jgi:hypothetical protein